MEKETDFLPWSDSEEEEIVVSEQQIANLRCREMIGQENVWNIRCFENPDDLSPTSSSEADDAAACQTRVDEDGDLVVRRRKRKRRIQAEGARKHSVIALHVLTHTPITTCGRQVQSPNRDA